MAICQLQSSGLHVQATPYRTMTHLEVKKAAKDTTSHGKGFREVGCLGPAERDALFFSVVYFSRGTLPQNTVTTGVLKTRPAALAAAAGCAAHHRAGRRRRSLPTSHPRVSHGSGDIQNTSWYLQGDRIVPGFLRIIVHISWGSMLRSSASSVLRHGFRNHPQDEPKNLKTWWSPMKTTS